MRGSPDCPQAALLHVVLILALSAVPCRVLAVDAGNDDVNVSQQEGRQEEVSIAIDPSRPDTMVVAGHVAAGWAPLMGAWYSLDGGQSWTLNGIGASADTLPSATNRWDPSVTIAPGGMVFVGYVAVEVAANGGKYVVVARSIAADVPFQGAARIDSAFTSATRVDKPFVASGPKPDSGVGFNVYAAYTKGYFSPAFFVAASEDSGRTFARVVQVGDGSFGVPTVGPSGEVYVTWMDAPSQLTNSGIKVARSDDGGANFSVVRTIGYSSVCGLNRLSILPSGPRGIMAVPSIAVDGRSPGSPGGVPGRVYVTYVTRTSERRPETPRGYIEEIDDTDVVLQYSDDRGGRWSEPRVVHKSQTLSQFHPWVAVDQGTGAVAVQFRDTRADAQDLDNETWVAVSVDGGESWYEDRLSDGSSYQAGWGMLEYDGVVIAEDVVRGVWSGLPPGYSGDLVEEFFFDTIPVADVIDYRTLQVPSATYPTVQTAINEARAGDVVEIDGASPLIGAVTMSANVDLVPKAGTGQPILRAQADTAVVVPRRYYGNGLQGFQVDGFSEVGIAAAHPATYYTGSDNFSISDCVIEGGGTGVAAENITLALSDCTIGGGDVGISAGADTLAVSSCALLNQSDAGVDIAQSRFSLQGTTVTLSGESGTGAQISGSRHLYSGEPAGSIEGCTFTGGGFGVGATDSYLTVAECIVSGQTLGGITVVFDIGGNQKHTRVMNNLVHSIACAEDSIGIRVFGYRTNGASTAEIVGNTVDGWDIGVRVDAVGDIPDPEPVPPPPPPPPLPTFQPVIKRNLVSSGAARGFDFGDATPAVFTCNNAWSPVAGYDPYYPDAGIPNGNLTEDPLYCDGEDAGVPAFALQIDSPCAPGNVVLSLCPGELIGAVGVQCAEGELARSTVVAEGTAVTVLGDVTVPVGSTLDVKGGCQFSFVQADSQEGGSDWTKGELIVRGTLVAGEAQEAPVLFGSAGPNPAEGDWYGISVKSTGRAEIENVDIRHAVYGIVYLCGNEGWVKNSFFSDDQSRDILAGAGTDLCPLTIQGNTFDVGGGSGIELMSEVDGLTVTENQIVGGLTSVSGIELGIFSDDETPTISKNQVNSFAVGSCIRNSAACDPRIWENTLGGSQSGVRIEHGQPEISRADTVSEGNTIEENDYGLLVRGSGTVPLVRWNSIASNTYGVMVQTGADPDLGTALSDKGNNAIDGSLTNCLVNQNSGGVPQVRAQGNYFGDCVGGQPPTCWSGNVNTANWLCDSPLGSNSARVRIEEIGLAKGLAILGTAPNPVTGMTKIAFSLEGGGARVWAEVFDVTGKVVRRFGGGDIGSGTHEIHWDGRDDRGMKVSSGLYYIRLVANEDLSDRVRVLVLH